MRIFELRGVEILAFCASLIIYLPCICFSSSIYLELDGVEALAFIIDITIYLVNVCFVLAVNVLTFFLCSINLCCLSDDDDNSGSHFLLSLSEVLDLENK